MYLLESSSVDPPEEFDVDSSMSGEMAGEMSPEIFVKTPETQKSFNEESKVMGIIVITNLCTVI